MIWLIGNKGMLGCEVEALLRRQDGTYVASDHEVDITDFSALQEFSAGKPLTWIINCAAYTAVDKAEDEPELAFRINADGPRNIAAIVRHKGAKLIHISTDYVFDGSKEGAYEETDAPNPLGAYGKSKYAGEVNIAETLKEYFIIRTSWLYGVQGNNFVKTMLRLFRERDEIAVVGDQFGSPTHAADLAVAVMEIIRLNSAAYGVYHFSNAGKTSWYEFACEIYRIAKEKGLLKKDVLIRRITTEEYPTRARRPKNSYLGQDKFIKTFKLSPRNWQVALSACL